MKNIAILMCAAFLAMSCGSDDSNDTAPADTPEAVTPPVESPEEENPVVMPVDDPVNSTITYDENIKSIIDAKCTQCHGVSVSRGAPFSLTNFAEVTIGTRENRIAARATAGTMPPRNSGETALTQAEVALINQWIEDGALEN